ncbi:MAG: glycoside hydrolase family 2 TIM barrel-domain containing protein [Bacteroidales bacterium]|nr:beta-galactosidase [Bacteroidales bacterium]MDD2203725.1 glycoside hydrolase family 2 TIM barrel-domain containing protein [Bacteroidales bacterium]MDD3152675.1 glycoside hydrolase family 2 TIM barrel-domain containing protein [Bacteroidales bacterium]MDD3913337.1 glycoside hydrolase family 2 TIM barrel-domain containing protein [Bacteroidales bacterium]MDD4633368.1 glycoside hydrolase family 2 TIM barrel-domain containing protein [Bacteroidales bacterium]
MFSQEGTNNKWQIAGDKITTEWAEKIDINNVLPEYPRPIMERSEWQNLNGLWEYAITTKDCSFPITFDGEILVPFAVESALSGVGKTVTGDNVLWYKRDFTIPTKWKGQRVILNFGAVDWKADVWVNGIKVGSHTGGYTAFSLDITAAITTSINTIVIKVWDPTDKSYQPRGKQVSKPGGIWYTSVTGIWQTVWLEPVPENYISNVYITPDIDKNILTVYANINMPNYDNIISIKVFDNGKEVATGKALDNSTAEIIMPDEIKYWSPDSPFLYDLEISLISKGKTIDKVESYAAMRKISTKKDENGVVRIQLNNEDIFLFGPLDQGWWPDGLYTAATDEALEYDIIKTKELGFNMIRKHVKVEPARWYAHCDRLGIIVWQDMPSGDKSPGWQNKSYYVGNESNRSETSKNNYYKEWGEIIDMLYSYPSIAVWVPFNESWGQFDTKKVVEWTKQKDTSRLINPASGGNHYYCGDILDIHNYPEPDLYLYDGERTTVLGEYGGIGYAIENHLWEQNRNWGYIKFNSTDEVTNEYIKLAETLLSLIPRGFSAAVYTQTTDVEIEVNGLMTYDRKIMKVDLPQIAEINKKICKSLD